MMETIRSECADAVERMRRPLIHDSQIARGRRGGSGRLMRKRREEDVEAMKRQCLDNREMIWSRYGEGAKLSRRWHEGVTMVLRG